MFILRPTIGEIIETEDLTLFVVAEDD